MADHLTPLDTAFLELEDGDESSHMHVGFTLVFEPLPSGRSPELDEVVALLEQRLDLLAHFKLRLSVPRVGALSWPEWVEDPAFDVRNQVRRASLPAPGGEAELVEWLADFYSHRLDRAHPLWEITLLDGLAEGRWALACKVHHCLVDGMSGALVTSALLDAEPHPPAGSRGLLEALPEPPSGDPGGSPLALLVRSARKGMGAALHPRRLAGMVERSRALADFILHDELVSAPQSSLNGEVGATRRMAAIAVPLDELKQIKNSLGGTVNDVVLAACAGGLRRLLESRGEPLPAAGMRAQVPVSVREASESLALGNRVSSLFVDLPVHSRTASSRYRETVSATSRLKAGRRRAGADTMVDLAGLAPPVLHALVARLSFAPRLFNITITNVPGAQLPLYAFGARMLRAIPLVPIFARHAVGIAVVSYDGELTFGLNADRATVPDLAELAEGIAEELSELSELAGRSARPASVLAHSSPAA
jgi:WS/DGAT/MGAT family acyltransferase